MGLFDIVNKVAGGKPQEVVNQAVTMTQAKKNLTELDPGFGGGATQPNPAFAAWQAQRQKLEADLAAVGSDPKRAGIAGQIQRMIQDHDANRPPETINTALGDAVQKNNETGAAAAAQLSAGGQQIRDTGAAAAAGQQSSGQIFQQLSNDAGARTGPTLDVQGGARSAQKDALAAATAFTPNATGAAGIRDAGATGAAGIGAAGNAATTNLNAFQASREGVNALQKFAKGPTGPSAAEALLRLQAARDKAAAISRARSVRGGPGAVAEAMKVAQAEGAAMAADTRGQMAVTRAQEAAQIRGENLQATSAAAQLIGQNEAQRLQAAQSAGQLGVQSAAAAGELGVQAQTAATQADLQGSQQALQSTQIRADIANNVRAMDIDTAKAQLGADLQTMSMNDEQTRFFAGLGEQARQSGIQAQLQAQQTGIGADQAAAAVAMQKGQQAWQMLTTEQQMQLTRMGIERGVITATQQNQQQQSAQSMQFLGTMLMAGASVASDRRAKRDIKKAKSMAEALRKTPGSHYRYKSDKHGKGEHTGPMAQDLEKTREFRSAVVERGGVKTVDTGRLTMAHHAALSDLQSQIDRLAKLGRKGKAA